jgi:hypothetical protein
VKYNVFIQEALGEPGVRSAEVGQVVFDATVEAGQTKDLGDLPVKPIRLRGR